MAGKRPASTEVTTRWRGGNGEAWEKGPYFLRGLVSLAYVSGDPKLKKQAQVWIDSLLDTQREDGQIGPRANDDWWPRMVMLKILQQHYLATGDARVLTCLANYFRYQLQTLPTAPLAALPEADRGVTVEAVVRPLRSRGLLEEEKFYWKSKGDSTKLPNLRRALPELGLWFDTLSLKIF